MEAETYFEGIQSRIIEKLHQADENIRVAVAWFTDKEIIEQLEEIALRGVNVEIIISDNEINQNVDFSSLTDRGINILYYPLKGYGSMHHKFCIIDEKLVITGSYNWTVNAKSNNGENIHVVTDKESIKKYIDKFNRLKNDVMGIPNPEIEEEDTKSEIERKTEEIEEDFEEEWNIYLNSNVSNYDKERLLEQGKSSAANTSGNSEVIPNKMSMIFQTLKEDTEIDKKEVEKLKGRLENKIDNYQNINRQEASEKKSTVELNTEAQRKTLNQQIQNAEENIEVFTNNKNNIQENKIPSLENKIPVLENEIEEAKLEITRPPLRRRVWLEGILLIFLSVYLYIFYSSIIYTILYGREDALEYMNVYGKLPEMEIFNSEALGLAIDKGIVTFLFISFFTILPFVFGFLFHSIKKKWFARWAYLIAALILDGLLAYLICKNVYHIDYQASREVELWEPIKVFSIARFWIVLVLGAVPYLAWGALYEHITDQFDAVSRSVNHHKTKHRIKTLKNSIQDIKEKIDSLADETNNIENEIVNEKSRIQQLQTEINHLEYEEKLKVDRIDQELNLIQQKLDNQKHKILTYLDKDQIPVTRSIFKERVNTFMNGWEQWLYSFYNTALADKKFYEAQQQVENWTNQNFKNV